MALKNDLVVEFFHKPSEALAYVLGFFAADGNLSVNKRGGCYVAFYSKDRQIIEDIRNVIGSKNKISEIQRGKSSRSHYRIQIGSKEIVEILKELGFSTSKTKHLPFPLIEKIYLAHFVRGYFDGDGNIWQGEVHKERRTKLLVLQLVFTSGAYNFLEQLKLYLHGELGTNGTHVISKRGLYSRLQFSTQDALKIYSFMYNGSINSLYLKRKKEQFDEKIKKLRL